MSHHALECLKRQDSLEGQDSTSLGSWPGHTKPGYPGWGNSPAREAGEPGGKRPTDLTHPEYIHKVELHLRMHKGSKRTEDPRVIKLEKLLPPPCGAPLRGNYKAPEGPRT